MFISFFNANRIVHKEFVPPWRTANNNFICRCRKDYAIVYGKNGQKCGAAMIGSFTMPLPTRPWVRSSFWQIPWRLPLTSSLFTPSCAMPLFSVPSYETPDERDTFCWCRRSENENARGLEQHQHWRVPQMFSAVGKTWVQVHSRQKVSNLKETRIIIVYNRNNF